jgi:hypothetical protein
MTNEEFMDFMVDNSCENLPLDAISEVLERLAWCFADNGGAIDKQLKVWIQSEDSKRVEIALRYHDAFIFESILEMKTILLDVEKKYSHLSGLCVSLYETWFKELGPDYENKKK